ncbi:hypothetical protein J5TS2_05030 [Brevibacillus halotolerans]|nr:hypothetical protein J5TS2_05030 [Brevibacillus halotolerans]
MLIYLHWDGTIGLEHFIKNELAWVARFILATQYSYFPFFVPNFSFKNITIHYIQDVHAKVRKRFATWKVSLL